MLFQLARQFSITSTKFFVLLAGASVIFVYFLSPTRESVYQLIGANLGLRLWWLDDLPIVPEEHKMLAALILVGLLAISIMSTKLLGLLTGASVVFVYLVSPLRDPAYKPMGANGGTHLWWLQDMREGHWMLGASILATLLAINLTLNLRQWCGIQTDLMAHLYRGNKLLSHFLVGMMHFVVGIVIWVSLSYVFVFYLLMQWIVD